MTEKKIIDSRIEALEPIVEDFIYHTLIQQYSNPYSILKNLKRHPKHILIGLSQALEMERLERLLGKLKDKPEEDTATDKV